MQIRHLPPLVRFIPQFAQICIIFPLGKFEANPSFRPVLALYIHLKDLSLEKRIHYLSDTFKCDHLNKFATKGFFSL